MLAFRVLWMVIAVLVIFGARFWSLHEDAHAKFLKISMQSSVNSVAQVFFNIGQGFTEESSSKRAVNNNTEFSEYRFVLPDHTTIFNLRFDPLISSGQVKIRQVSITDGLGNTFFHIDLKQLTAAHQIKRFDIINDRISMDTDANASDPQIYIQFEKPFLQKVHPSYHKNLSLSLFVIILSIFSIYLWVNWSDKKNIKKLICSGLVATGFVIVVFYCLHTCMGIFNRSVQPFGGGDTEVYLHMAALKWTNPYLYHGLRPPTVPILYSLVNGAENIYNITLLQIIISFASWLYLAFMTVYYLKDYLAKAFAFFLIAFIPLIAFMHYWNLVVLSESLSFSFLAVFLGTCLWYYNKRSIPSVIVLAIVALIFAFIRDTDAYRVLLMTLPILLLIVQQIRNQAQRIMRHVVLFIIFVLIFIGSNYSTSNIHCRDCVTSHMNARWFMPTMNNLFQRILPFEDRVKYFVDHGLPVTPELMAMTYKWASSDNWQSAFDPKLAAQREWNYRHGRQTYMKYLITHPKYVFSSAFDYREALLYLDGTPNAWFHEMVIPVNTRILSVFFLNDDRDLKMFFVLCLASLILVIMIYVRRREKDEGVHIRMIPLTCYIILVPIPIGILIFHGDLMDLARHSFTNIIQLNLGFVLFYLFMADLLMMKMQTGASEK